MSLNYMQERLLSSDRLESDKTKDVSHKRPTWDLAKRVLGRWRWYACSLLVSIIVLFVVAIFIEYSIVPRLRRDREFRIE